MKGKKKAAVGAKEGIGFCGVSVVFFEFIVGFS